ncbi:DHA2 family efflux MFS transporter permease subunit [Leeia aquatica]|uniref:DHA2 family efflux MFS transporter permease subunit n=1 Tax=Leeia aquatica TaxID=2725557 RepID=A0A847SCW5_9NEIS|nr:DHA2 family efflux MFS transporter permease subunit [Leeia aquatica]NLR76765.1 DHA2 family efflux MFS transporter permease subunit [Leeia aquatica]
MKPWLPGLARTTSKESQYASRYIIALTVTLASVLELLDTSIVNVAIPHMMGTLGATLDEIAWVSTGYVVANVIVLPISGWLSVQFGRRNYFAFSIIVFIISSVACGNATSLGGLVFWRIVQGLGGGGLLSTAQSTLSEVFPPQEMGSAFAIFGLGIMVGPMLGPTVGGYLTENYSWPWIFYINVPLGALALLLSLQFVPDSRHGKKAESVDYIGLLLLAIGVGALQTLLERGERLEWLESNEVITYIVASILGLSAFIIRQLEIEHPIVDVRVVKDKQFAAGMIFGFILGAALYSTVFVFPVYVQTLMGFNAWQTGMAILPSAIASGIMMMMSSKLLQRGVKPTRIIFTGVVIFLFSMWQHQHFTTLSGADDFFWPLVLRGIGLGLIFVPLSSVAMANIPLHETPNATGIYNLCRQLGGSVGIAVSATLLSSLQNANRSSLLVHTALNDPATQERLQALQQHFASLSPSEGVAKARALATLSNQISKQAAMLSYEQLFFGFGLVMLLVLPLLTVMKKTRAGNISSDAH